MRLGNTSFMSKAAASLMLAFSLAGSPAQAQEADGPDIPNRTNTLSITNTQADNQFSSFESLSSVHRLANASSQDAGAETERAQETPDIRNSDIVTVRSIDLDPHDPRTVWGGLLLMAALFSLYNLKNREQGAAFRVGTALLFTGIFLNPEITEEQHQELPTEVAVVVDKSTSQTFADRQEMTNAIYERLSGKLGDIDNINIRIIEAGQDADGIFQDGTYLFESLRNGIADVPRERLGAVILLTDGQVHDLPDPDQSTIEGVPFHVLLSGDENERDRILMLEGAPHFGSVNETQTIRFKVADRGADDQTTGKIPVRMRVNDDSTTVRYVTPGETVSVDVKLTRAGTNVVALEAETLEGELTEANNRIVIDIDGIREDLNVLLISGQPGKATRTWRNMLKSDPDVNLVHFSLLRTSDKLDDTSPEDLALVPFPYELFESDKIGQFDLVIFDDYEYQRVLSPLDFKNIAEYVKKGGAVFVTTGSDLSKEISLENTLLGEIMPVQADGGLIEKPYRPDVTEKGKRHPVTRNLKSGQDSTAAPWGRWALQADTRARDGDVVMDGADGNPLLILDRVKEGRIGVLTSNQAWLWERGFDGGGPYDDLLRRTTHWLLKNPALEEEALRLRHEDGKVAVELQTMDDTPSSVTIRTPSGETISVTPEKVAPGLWRTDIPAKERGLYSALLEGEKALTAFENIGRPDNIEYDNTISTFEKLEPFVRAGGGTMRRMTDEDGAVSVPGIVLKGPDESLGDAERGGDLAIRTSGETILKGIEKDPLPPDWMKLALVIGLLGLTWYREGGGTFSALKDRLPGGGNTPETPKP